MYDHEQNKVQELLESAQQACRSYSASTGIDCYVIDIEGNPLAREYDKDFRCRFCQGLYEITGKIIPCRRVQLYGAYQAEILGGQYIYFCPTSLLHWTVPLVYKGLMMGAMVAGPALLMNPKELLEIDYPRNFPLRDDQTEWVEQLLKTVPRLDTDKSSHLCRTLALMGKGLSIPIDLQQKKYREKATQQSSIGSYIQKLKKEENEITPNPYPLEKENDLLTAIRKGDRGRSSELLNEILGHIYFTEGQNFEKVRNSGIELTILLSRAALKGGAGEQHVWALKKTYIRKIQESANSLELTYQLDQLLKLFMDQLFNLKDIKHKDSIFRSFQYIRTHYGDQITLGEIAAEACLSPSYFSTVFKEEVGESFKNYLNRYRVERSKELLMDSNMVIGDIARLTGFDEQSYFTRIFKKYSGLSPKEYRDKRI